jgi:hypothetical protein
MAKFYANVNPAIDTFSGLIAKTNSLLYDMSTGIVSVDFTTNGAVASGNGGVNGILFAQTMVATSALRGGNTTSNAVLTITTNVAMDGVFLTVGNTTINSVVNTTTFRTGSASVFTVVNATSFSGTSNNSTNFGGLSLATVQGQITGNAATAYTNAIAIAANATNLTSGTVNTLRLPAAINVATSVYVGGASIFTVVNATSFSGTANNSNNLGGSSLSTVQGQITGNAATAYTNAIAIAANATNLTSGTVNTARLPAAINVATSVYVGDASIFTVVNATSFSGTANNSNNFGGSSLSTVQGQITGNAATAYTNAIAIAANATNLTSGTVNTARLPAAINVATSVYVGGASIFTVVNATAFSGTANNSNNLGGVTLTTIQGYVTSNATAAYTNATSYTDTKAGTAYSNAVTIASTDASTKAGTAYTNAVAIATNATNISTGTINTARLPAVMNVATSVSVGNSTVNSVVNTTSFYTGNASVYTTVNSTAFSGTSNNSTNLGGVTLATVSGYITGNATASSTDASTKAGTAYANAVANSAADASTKAGTAYTNAVAIAAADATSKAGTAYSNAVAAVANATNLTTGTVNTARLPAAINVATSVYVGGASIFTVVNATSFSGTANSANVLTTGRYINVTSDATGGVLFNGSSNVAIALTLTNTAVTPGVYGNSISYPLITVDSKGRVTNLSAFTYTTTGAGVVSSFNTRTGDITLTNGDITSTLTYTPLSANGTGTISGGLTLTNSDLNVRDVLSSREIRVGNASVNSVTNSTSFSGTSANTILFAGSSLATIQAQITGNAATAYSNGTAYADTKAGTAYTNAIAIAATDASTKAGTAYSNAVTIASTDASTKAGTAYTNALARATTLSSAAYTNALGQATTLSSAAYSNAIAGAATDASTKAGTAYTNAIAIAAADATNKAGTAYSNAIANAASSAAALYVAKTGGTISGDVVITGNLNITGTTVYANVTNLDVKDLNITVAKGAASNAASDGAGITVDVPNAQIFYSGSSNTWNLNRPVTPGSNAVFDLGANLLRWNTIYGVSVNSTNITGTLQTASQPNITANNSTYLNGAAASSYQTTAGLSANVLLLAANVATYLGNNSGTYANIVTSVGTAYTNAVATSATDASTKAGTAYTNAIAIAATDATSKAGTAYSNAVTISSTDASTKAGTAYSNAVTIAATDASTKAGTAYSNAIAVAATDSSTKAGIAYTNAVSTAATDASTKAGTAYTNAVATAATDASTKAGTAYTNAIAIASTDASTKAGTAYTNAIAIAANATNLTSGTVSVARIPTSYVNTTANFTVSGNIEFTGANTTINGAEIGYLDIPQRIISAGANTLTANDAGSHIYNTNTTATFAVTVPNNTSVALRNGTAITLINGGNVFTVAAGTGVTLKLAASTSTGTRTIANNAVATLIKVATETWYISGAGVT